MRFAAVLACLCLTASSGAMEPLLVFPPELGASVGAGRRTVFVALPFSASFGRADASGRNSWRAVLQPGWSFVLKSPAPESPFFWGRLAVDHVWSLSPWVAVALGPSVSFNVLKGPGSSPRVGPELVGMLGRPGSSALLAWTVRLESGRDGRLVYVTSLALTPW